jgi:hypothetical protein
MLVHLFYLGVCFCPTCKGLQIPLEILFENVFEKLEKKMENRKEPFTYSAYTARAGLLLPSLALGPSSRARSPASPRARLGRPRAAAARALSPLAR